MHVWFLRREVHTGPWPGEAKANVAMLTAAGAQPGEPQRSLPLCSP